MHKLDMLDKETARLYQLLQSLQSNKTKEDKIWNNFCKEMNKEKAPKKYFKKHPKHISNSSSEILSPRSNVVNTIKRVAKSANSIKFVESSNKSPQLSDSSIEIVTIREEFPIKSARNSKVKDTSSNSDKKITTILDKKRIKSKDSISKEKLTQSSKKPHSKQVRDNAPDIKNEEKVQEIHRDNFEKKFRSIIDKSLHCMEDIRMQLDIGISKPDGVEDLDRRKRRSTEFASRFSRNYLYQLNRQISDMKKIQKPSSARTTSQNTFTMRQKLTSSHQTILQGLQAFLGHLPVSTPLAVPEKVKELLREVTSLCDIHRQYESTDINSNVKDNAEIIDIFEIRSKCLIDKIEECYTTPSALNLLQSNSKYSLIEQNKCRKRGIKSRFSMYTGPVNRKDVYWKKAISSLAKKKFNVRSKYKTAQFKHRPPAEKTSQHKPIIKAKHLERKSSCNLRSKSIIDNDNIKTMMEIQKEKDHQMGIPDGVSCVSQMEDLTTFRSGSYAPVIEERRDTLNTDNKEMSQQHLRCVLKGVVNNANQTDNDLMGELATKLLPPQQTPKSQRPPDTIQSNGELVDKLVEVIWNHSQEKCNKNADAEKTKIEKKKRSERKKTVTVTGAKNAQLICIRDEDSIYETSFDNSLEKCRSNSPASQKPQLQLHNEGLIEIQNKDVNFQQSNVQQPTITECAYVPPQQTADVEKPAKINSARTPRMKISRLPKTQLQPLKMLPKKFALNILEYKINYLKARKGNHMYRKSAVKQPWILMGEISDKILDELIHAVGAEIQIDHIIDGIIASEFV